MEFKTFFKKYFIVFCQNNHFVVSKSIFFIKHHRRQYKNGFFPMHIFNHPQKIAVYWYSLVICFQTLTSADNKLKLLLRNLYKILVLSFPLVEFIKRHILSTFFINYYFFLISIIPASKNDNLFIVFIVTYTANRIFFLWVFD